MKEKLPIHFAPLQGYTDAIYRQAHARIFGGIESYYTPFVRIEHGDFRRKDVRELEVHNNRGVILTPQLIASTPETILRILSLFIDKNYRKVDINLGCPFPTLAKRHNGAGLLPHPDEVEALLTTVLEAHPDLQFSVKMRLGWEDANECMALLPLLNSLPLSHITMHPRLGKQQYKGEVDLDAFERFYNECQKPLIYNGDLLTTNDIESIARRFPRLAGVMIGRGLLANPALAIEYQQGEPLSPQAKLEKIRLLHADVFSQYGNLLEGGDQQLLAKMRTFWEYLLPDGDRKAKKVIHKTSKLSNYQAAVSNLLR